MKGIYSFGRESKEKLERISQLESELLNTETMIQDLYKSKEKLNNDLQEEEKKLKDFIWNKLYKKHENEFKKLYERKIGSKDRFQEFILNLKKSDSAEIKTIEESKKEYDILYDDEVSILEKIDLEINIEKINEIENDDLFQKRIIGKDDIQIAKLINKLDIADWVYEGKKHLDKIESDICPFCQEHTIKQEFRKQLEEYFDEEYKNNIDTLKQIKNKYVELTQACIRTLYECLQNIKNNKILSGYIDVKELEDKLKILSEEISKNYMKMENKIREPSKAIDLGNSSILFMEIKKNFDNLNKNIDEHNKKVQQISKQRKKLEQDFFSFLILNYSDDLNEKLKVVNGKKRGLENINKKIIDLESERNEKSNEIKQLNSELTSIETTIDKINSLLENFGFNSFKLQIKDEKFYEIIRENGEIAKETLSEGEVTFITFLYFLQLIEGSFNKESVRSNKILVIDDPISSLDSQVLFIVSTLIKEYINKARIDPDYFIKQIIILTHNVYFYKEISFTTQRERINSRNDTSYYILRKFNNESFIKYYKINPINSSYELLWIDLSMAIKSDNPCKSTIQNTMRKILENYFKVFGGITNDDDIINKFDSPEEKYICKSLISWINEGSHTIPDDFEVQLQDQEIEKYIEVFEKIFKRMGHEAHLNMMKKY